MTGDRAELAAVVGALPIETQSAVAQLAAQIRAIVVGNDAAGVLALMVVGLEASEACADPL